VDQRHRKLTAGNHFAILRIRYIKQVKKATTGLGSKGRKLFETHPSSLNLIRIECSPSQSASDLKQAQRLFARPSRPIPPTARRPSTEPGGSVAFG
jgi:hypothetical protein